MNKIANDVSAVWTKLQGIHEAIAIREKSEVSAQNYAHINEEIRKLREKLNEDNMTKIENRELKFEVECLMQLNHNQMRKYEEDVKRLEGAVHRISIENKKVRGFTPTEDGGFLWVKKIRNTHFLRTGSKAVRPMS
jgi:hypothetical protein